MTLVDRVLNAGRPEDLFEELEKWDPDPTRALDKAFKRFSWVHPDRCDDPRAEEAFKHLGTLVQSARAKVSNGRYGETEIFKVQAKRHTYEFGKEPIFRGDSCDLFFGDYNDGLNRVLAKVPRSAKDNALLGNEAKVIRTMLREKEDFDLCSPYIPTFIESFQMKTGSGRRRANVFAYTPGFHNMRRVREVYQRGVHPKDAAWMFRRMLVALGCVHKRGYIHGAVMPQHMLIQAEQHGLVLLDWKHATPLGEPMKTIPAHSRHWYHDRALESKEAKPEFDIYQAALCMEYICGGADALPRQLRAFYKGCKATSLPEAWELKDEFDELIERMWGPRRFKPFSMPVTS